MNFYIVKGYNNGNKILANLVFSPDKKGDRYNSELKSEYKKVIENNHVPSLIDYDNILKIYNPRQCFKREYQNLKGIWKKIADSLIKIGVSKNDIGIFGSYLLGFELKKDIDFAVYGISNYELIKKNIAIIRKLSKTTPITREHMAYQAKTHGKFYSKKNNFKKIFLNKWSSLQIAPNILTTIRFVYKENEIPDIAKYPFKKNGKEVIIKGKVIEDDYTNFIPRIFKIKSENKTYDIITYFWIFQSCVKKGQIVEIKGYADDDIILVSKFSHYINIK